MKIVKRILILIIGLFVVWSSAGCDTYEATNHYPWYRSDNWYCAQIDMQLCFRDHAGKNPASTGFSWAWKETAYEVSVGFMASAADFYQRVPSEGDENLAMLLRCRWHYEDENLVMTILEDNLFDGVFTELVFVPQ